MDPKKTKAKKVMRSKVFTVRPEMPVRELAQTLEERQLCGAPVVDAQGELLGVISKSDVVHYQCEGDLSPDQLAYYRQDCRDLFPAGFHGSVPDLARVRDIMREVIVEIDEDAPVAAVAGTMRKENILRILVTKARRIRGEVTAMDLLKLLES